MRTRLGRNCYMAGVVFLSVGSLLLAGCATISELTGEAEREREEKQELQETVRKLGSKNEKLQEEVQHLKLELDESSEKESDLSEEVQRFRDEKAKLETQLLSSRKDQKTLEKQLMKADTRLSQLIGKEKKKLTQLQRVKGELSSRLGKFGCRAIEERGEAIVVVLEDVLTLSSGKVGIRESSFPLLRELAAVLKKHRDFELIVEGHTDDIPTKRSYPSNWELSSARALVILHYLEQEGVVPERLSAVGRGEYMPRASNSTAEGRRKNRRVEIVILKGSDR